MKKIPDYTFYNVDEHLLPDLGKTLGVFLTERRIRKNSLAQILKIDPTGVIRYTKKKSFQCTILWKLSYALNHNFFQDLAAQLPPQFTTNAPDPTLPLLEQIATLEEEIKLLSAKMETLKEVMRR